MIFKEKDLLSKRRIVLGVFAFTIFTSIVVYGIARHTIRKPMRTNIESPKPYLSAVSDSDQKERVQRELVTIRPTGFDPTEIRRVSGPFLLAIDNRSGSNTVTLRLSRERGDKLQDVPLTRGHLKWRERINLTTGEYSLTEENHPDWSCRITIVP